MNDSSSGVGLHIRNLTKDFRRPGSPPAVDGVSASLERGSATAVVGPNGAGKSTMLRLIAGILTPTSGSVHRPERCASLLELGAAFHPDLTGWENIDMTLALAGVARRSRGRRSNDVADLAGIGDAIMRPVKHLSNGMVGRLACAAAVIAEPDLLLIDEVLAVGDSSFQREMLQRVDALVAKGTMLVLVTHSLELAAAATTRTIWLEQGRLVEDGPTPEVLNRYEASVRGWGRAFGGSPVEITGIRIDPDHILPGDPVKLRATVSATEDTGPLEIRVEVRPIVGQDSIWMRSNEETLEMRHLNLVAATTPVRAEGIRKGDHHIEMELAAVSISPTEVEVALLLADEHDRILDEVTCTLAIGDAPLRPHYHLGVIVHRTSKKS